MWKAAFGSRSDRTDAASTTSRRKKSRTSDSVVDGPRSTVSRRDERDKPSRSEASRSSGVEKSERRSKTSSGNMGLTEGALRQLDDQDEWEDDGALTRQVSTRSEGGKSRRRRDTKSEKSRSRSRERQSEKKRRSTRGADVSEESRRYRDSRRIEEPRPERALQRSRTLPTEAVTGLPLSQSPPLMSGGLVGERPPMQHSVSMPVPVSRADSYGHAADYYLDEGQSVQTQPGVRISTPNMLSNPDTHLMSASAEPNPVADTGNGSAADFYNGKVSPVAFEPKPSQLTNNESNPKPKPKPSSFPGLAAAAVAATAGAYIANGMASNAADRPPANSSGGFAASESQTYYSQTNSTNASHYIANGTNASSNTTSATAYQGPNEAPTSLSNGHGAIPASAQIYDHNESPYPMTEFKNPVSRLKESLLNLFSSPEDIRKMEEYTEYIGVCKYCFDPRSSPGSAPRQHHFHGAPTRQNSLRKRNSSGRIRPYASNESLRRRAGTRVDKDTRYSTSERTRHRTFSNEDGMTAGVATAGLAATALAAATSFSKSRKGSNDAQNNNTEYRRTTSSRRRSRSSSQERRPRSSFESRNAQRETRWATVRTRDGRIDRRRISDLPSSVTQRREAADREPKENVDEALSYEQAQFNDKAGSRSEKVSRRFGTSAENRSRRRSSSSASSSSGRGFFGMVFSPRRASRNAKRERRSRKETTSFFNFGNNSASSSDSALAFGQPHTSRSDLSLKRRKSRRGSDQDIAATVAGISATAAALAAAQHQRKYGKRNKQQTDVRNSRREFGHKKEQTTRRVADDEDEWVDELPSDVDDHSSANESALAFGGPSPVQSADEDSDSSRNGLSAWGWRWGNKAERDSRRRRVEAPSNDGLPAISQDLESDRARYPTDATRKSMSAPRTDAPASYAPARPLEFVDPRPIVEHSPSQYPAGDQRQRPAIQQPQPIAPIQPSFVREGPSAADGIDYQRRDTTNPERRESSRMPSLAEGAALVAAGILATQAVSSSQNAKPSKPVEDVKREARRAAEIADAEDREQRVRSTREDEIRQLAEAAISKPKSSKGSKPDIVDGERRGDGDVSTRTKSKSESREPSARSNTLDRERTEVKPRQDAKPTNTAQEVLPDDRTPDREQAEVDSRRETKPTYAAQEVLPDDRGSVEHVFDHDLMDRDFFRRTREEPVATREARQTEIARKAADKVIADMDAYYAQPETSQEEFFAPKDILSSESAEAKTQVAGPDADLEVIASDELEHDRRYKLFRNSTDKDRFAPYGVPGLKVISPTPPPGERLSSRSRARSPLSEVRSADAEPTTKDVSTPEDSPVVNPAEQPVESFVDEVDDAAPRRDRSKRISWGQDKTHVFEPHTPDSFEERDSYMDAQYAPQYASPVQNSESHEAGSPPRQSVASSATTTDAPAGRSESRNRKSSDSSSITKGFAGVAAAMMALTGARPSKDVPQKDDEKFDAQVRNSSRDEPSVDSSVQPEEDGPILTSSTASKEREVHDAVKAADTDQVSNNPDPLFETKSDRHEVPREDSLSKKERKKREKAEKREGGLGNGSYNNFADIVSSVTVKPFSKYEPSREPSVGEKGLNESDNVHRDDIHSKEEFPGTSANENPITNTALVDDVSWEPPLSKKEQKKRDKAAKRSSTFDEDFLNYDVPAESSGLDNVDAREEPAWEPPLSKKEQKKRDKAAKYASMLEDEPQESLIRSADPTSSADASLSDVSARQPSLVKENEEQTRSVPDSVVESGDLFENVRNQSVAADSVDEPAWEPPLNKKEQKKREKAMKRESLLANEIEEPSLDETPASVADNAELEETVLEPVLSKKEQKKRDKAAKRQSTGDIEFQETPADSEADTGNNNTKAEEPAWEPPLSKKEQKKRDKSAKRQSTIDQDPWMASAEAIADNVETEEPAWEAPVSKKEQKKRNKNAERESTPDVDSEETSGEAIANSVKADEPVWEPPLSKKEQKKREKAAKRQSTFDENKEETPAPAIPDVETTEERAWEPPLSKKELKQREKLAKREAEAEAEAKKAREETSVEAIPNDMETEEPAWEASLSKKELKKREKAAKREAEIDQFIQPEEAAYSAPAQEPDNDPWQPPISKKEQKKRDKAAKRQSTTNIDPEDKHESANSETDKDESRLNGGDSPAPAQASSSPTLTKTIRSTGAAAGVAALVSALTAKASGGDATKPGDAETSKQELSRMPGSWDEPLESDPADAVDPFKYQIKDDAPGDMNEDKGEKIASSSRTGDAPRKNRDSARFSEPMTNSPLRSEWTFDDYIKHEAKHGFDPSVLRDDEKTASASTRPHAVSDDLAKDDETSSRSAQKESRKRDDRDRSNGERDGSVDAASISRDRDSSLSKKSSRRRSGSDPYGAASKTESNADSDEQDPYESARKPKRFSKYEDDDDNVSVVSSRSRRSRDDASSSSKKEKKSGILGLFRRKSVDATTSPYSSERKGRAAKYSDDDDDDKRSRRSRREESNDSHTMDKSSVTASEKKSRRSRRSDDQPADDDNDDDADEARSTRSQSARGLGDEFDDEDDPGQDTSPRKNRKGNSENDSKDQSFLGARVENLPSLPDNSNELSTSAIVNDEQENGNPVSAEVQLLDHPEDAQVVHEIDQNHSQGTDPNRDLVDQESDAFESLPVQSEESQASDATSHDSTAAIDLTTLPPLPDSPLVHAVHDDDAQAIHREVDHAATDVDLATLPALPDSPQSSPATVLRTPQRVILPIKATVPTSVPLRFPFVPARASPRDRTNSISIPTPTPPATPSSSKKSRPTSFEMRPLYLVEVNRKIAEIDEVLPSLPSSKTTSRASSVHDFDDATSASGSESRTRRRRMTIDSSATMPWHGEDVEFASGQTTPRAGEKDVLASESRGRSSPQFYTWDDFRKDEWLHQQAESVAPEAAATLHDLEPEDEVAVEPSTQVPSEADQHESGYNPEQRGSDLSSDAPGDSHARDVHVDGGLDNQHDDESAPAAKMASLEGDEKPAENKALPAADDVPMLESGSLSLNTTGIIKGALAAVSASALLARQSDVNSDSEEQTPVTALSPNRALGALHTVSSSRADNDTITEQVHRIPDVSLESPSATEQGHKDTVDLNENAEQQAAEDDVPLVQVQRNAQNTASIPNGIDGSLQQSVIGIDESSDARATVVEPISQESQAVDKSDAKDDVWGAAVPSRKQSKKAKKKRKTLLFDAPLKEAVAELNDHANTVASGTTEESLVDEVPESAETVLDAQSSQGAEHEGKVVSSEQNPDNTIPAEANELREDGKNADTTGMSANPVPAADPKSVEEIYREDEVAVDEPVPEKDARGAEPEWNDTATIPLSKKDRKKKRKSKSAAELDFFAAAEERDDGLASKAETGATDTADRLDQSREVPAVGHGTAQTEDASVPAPDALAEDISANPPTDPTEDTSIWPSSTILTKKQQKKLKKTARKGVDSNDETKEDIRNVEPVATEGSEPRKEDESTSTDETAAPAPENLLDQSHDVSAIDGNAAEAKDISASSPMAQTEDASLSRPDSLIEDISDLSPLASLTKKQQKKLKRAKKTDAFQDDKTTDDTKDVEPSPAELSESRKGDEPTGDDEPAPHSTLNLAGQSDDVLTADLGATQEEEMPFSPSTTLTKKQQKKLKKSKRTSVFQADETNKNLRDNEQNESEPRNDDGLTGEDETIHLPTAGSPSESDDVPTTGPSAAQTEETPVAPNTTLTKKQQKKLKKAKKTSVFQADETDEVIRDNEQFEPEPRKDDEPTTEENLPTADYSGERDDVVATDLSASAQTEEIPFTPSTPLTRKQQKKLKQEKKTNFTQNDETNEDVRDDEEIELKSGKYDDPMVEDEVIPHLTADLPDVSGDYVATDLGAAQAEEMPFTSSTRLTKKQQKALKKAAKKGVLLVDETMEDSQKIGVSVAEPSEARKVDKAERDRDNTLASGHLIADGSAAAPEGDDVSGDIPTPQQNDQFIDERAGQRTESHVPPQDALVARSDDEMSNVNALARALETPLPAVLADEDTLEEPDVQIAEDDAKQRVSEDGQATSVASEHEPISAATLQPRNARENVAEQDSEHPIIVGEATVPDLSIGEQISSDPTEGTAKEANQPEASEDAAADSMDDRLDLRSSQQGRQHLPEDDTSASLEEFVRPVESAEPETQFVPDQTPVSPAFAGQNVSSVPLSYEAELPSSVDETMRLSPPTRQGFEALAEQASRETDDLEQRTSSDAQFGRTSAQISNEGKGPEALTTLQQNDLDKTSELPDKQDTKSNASSATNVNLGFDETLAAALASSGFDPQVMASREMVDASQNEATQLEDEEPSFQMTNRNSKKNKKKRKSQRKEDADVSFEEHQPPGVPDDIAPPAAQQTAEDFDEFLRGSLRLSGFDDATIERVISPERLSSAAVDAKERDLVQEVASEENSKGTERVDDAAGSTAALLTGSEDGETREITEANLDTPEPDLLVRGGDLSVEEMDKQYSEVRKKARKEKKKNKKRAIETSNTSPLPPAAVDKEESQTIPTSTNNEGDTHSGREANTTLLSDVPSVEEQWQQDGEVSVHADLHGGHELPEMPKLLEDQRDEIQDNATFDAIDAEELAAAAALGFGIENVRHKQQGADQVDARGMESFDRTHSAKATTWSFGALDDQAGDNELPEAVSSRSKSTKRQSKIKDKAAISSSRRSSQDSVGHDMSLGDVLHVRRVRGPEAVEDILDERSRTPSNSSAKTSLESTSKHRVSHLFSSPPGVVPGVRGSKNDKKPRNVSVDEHAQRPPEITVVPTSHDAPSASKHSEQIALVGPRPVDRNNAYEQEEIARTSSASSHRSLRRSTRSVSGDLRIASPRMAESAAGALSARGMVAGIAARSARTSPPATFPSFEAPPTPPLQDEERDQVGYSILAATAGGVAMSDVFSGYGGAERSQVSPTRPPSVRKRQSMHIVDLESRLNQLVEENRALQLAQEARHVQLSPNAHAALAARDAQLREKDVELARISGMLGPMQEEIARLSEINHGLTEANRNLVDDTNGRYATLQDEHAAAHEQWQSASRDLQHLQAEHGRLQSSMRSTVEDEIASALADRNAEILRLREQLDVAHEQIRSLQVQIEAHHERDFLTTRDEDYFDGACQKLCQHVQQWVLRFSKLSDNRVCRLSSEMSDEKIETRIDNAMLDGSDADKLLVDRIRRRDVFMSVVMTMVWEYVFARYLFGMDREQRQKLKALERILAEVGPPRAVAQWRATTLTLLCKRPEFATQCALDTEAVAVEIFTVLCALLPPPTNMEQQLRHSLQKVIRVAVDLHIEMRTQRAEYIMLPPLQPEYDTNGDLLRKVYFNASLMNERSGLFSSNQTLERERATVKIVLFPLVVKKGNELGEGEEEIVVCPAQVLVQNDQGRSKKVVRVMSGAMEIDDPRRSRQSLRSITPGSVAF